MIPSSELIDLLGGTTQVARFLGIKAPSVHEWRGGSIPLGKRVLLARRVESRSSGRWRRWDVCPEAWHLIWPELIGTEGAPPAPSEQQEVRDAA